MLIMPETVEPFVRDFNVILGGVLSTMNLYSLETVCPTVSVTTTFIVCSPSERFSVIAVGFVLFIICGDPESR